MRQPAGRQPIEPGTTESSAKASGQTGLPRPEGKPEPAGIRGLGIARALSKELAAFSQRLAEENALRAMELVAARSLPEIVEIQAMQLQAVSEAWLRHTARLGEIYVASLRADAE